MAVIHPFSALRPPAERAKQVSSVPYDVVNTDEARSLAARNPLSFLHVSRPELIYRTAPTFTVIPSIARLSRTLRS